MRPMSHWASDNIAFAAAARGLFEPMSEAQLQTFYDIENLNGAIKSIYEHMEDMDRRGRLTTLTALFL